MLLHQYSLSSNDSSKISGFHKNINTQNIKSIYSEHRLLLFLATFLLGGFNFNTKHLIQEAFNCCYILKVQVGSVLSETCIIILRK